MTEAEALDEAAKAAGWLHWDDARQLAERGEIEAIRAHAATIMENAALKAEIERLRNIITRLKGYAAHSDECAINAWMPRGDEPCPPCSCGLSALLEEIDRD